MLCSFDMGVLSVCEEVDAALASEECDISGKEGFVIIGVVLVDVVAVEWVRDGWRFAVGL